MESTGSRILRSQSRKQGSGGSLAFLPGSRLWTVSELPQAARMGCKMKAKHGSHRVGSEEGGALLVKKVDRVWGMTDAHRVAYPWTSAQVVLTGLWGFPGALCSEPPPTVTMMPCKRGLW